MSKKGDGCEYYSKMSFMLFTEFQFFAKKSIQKNSFAHPRYLLMLLKLSARVRYKSIFNMFYTQGIARRRRMIRKSR